jgi:hypothetical protein
MTLVDRAKNIILTPNTEWPVIASEPATQASLLSGYAIPLAAIGPICGFIGGTLVGVTVPFSGTVRVPIIGGLVGAVFTFCMAIVALFVVSAIINALAPTFGGEKNSTQAFKVAVYSYTPAFLAGVLQLVPLLGVLGVFAALYGLYLLYLGLPRLMKCPQDKAVPYTAVVVVCAIIVTIVIGAVTSVVVGGMMLGTRAVTGAVTGSSSSSSPNASIQFDKDSPLGKLQELGSKLEESSKNIEAAQKSGDPNAQAAAAVAGLGTLFGGGRRVDPVAIDQLKAFVPESFAGLPKKSSSAEKNGIAGLMVSKAEARYSNDAGKSVTLEISDTGGVSGLMSLASWAGVEGEKENDSGSEKTQKVGGRLVHERVSKTGSTNEFGLVLGDRFMVSAKGNGVGVNELKTAISSLDLAKLEAMKDAGVQK